MLLYWQAFFVPREGSECRFRFYIRRKNPAGRWRYKRVNIGPGRRPADLTGPFYLRYTAENGSQPYLSGGDTLEEAIKAAETLTHMLDAKAKGLSVPELDATNRVTIKAAIEDFLAAKKNKTKRTIETYRAHLTTFLEHLPINIRYTDELSGNTKAFRSYQDKMAAEGYEPKTIHNRMLNLRIFCKKAGIKFPLGWDEMPIVEEEPAVAYDNEELKKLFAAMNEEQLARYKFFLGSACRDKEATYAACQDLDITKGSIHLRSKPDVGFTLKSHESRTVPLPQPLIALLKERRKHAPHQRWIFANEEGRPDNHFLRKLKRIALHAGLNCSHCKTTITKGHDENKRQVEVTCRTDPVCEHWILHRFRKTCATRWHEHGVPIRTIQHWLGHKSLETTMLYLGVTDPEKLRSNIDKAFGD